jgi:type I restriction enzyme S subunit
MGLTKYKFGELIELTNEKNANGLYGEEDAIGVNIDKIIMPMRGNLEKKDFSNFHLVPPRHFAYNPRGSRKLGIGFNDTEKTFIITFNDNVFRIKETAKKKILDTYLFMYLCRKEWDRYAEFISWGSSTEVFDWNIFCEEEIFLPPIQIQQKYVDIYNAMLENQKSYEYGLEDLKLACDAYIEDLKHGIHCKAIGPYVERHDVRNRTNEIKNVMGVSTSKEFREPTSKVNRNELSNYKIVRPRQISFVQTTHNEKVFAYAFNNTEDTVKKRMISFESDKDQRKQFKEMTKELDDYILELYDKIDKDHNANAKMKNMDFSRYPFNTDDEYHFYIENYGNEVVDLEMFVEVFKKIGDNLNCIAGYYEEMATFVPDYD